MNIEEIKSAIRAELASDRLRGADNKELIQKACQRLFWSGIVPNKANVLETVRIEGSSPSAQTVGKMLDAFWASMRARLDVPDILAEGVPDEVLDVLKSIAPALAGAADKLGRKWMAGEVAEAQKRAAEAEDRAKAAEAHAHALEGDLASYKDVLDKATDRAKRLDEENQALKDEVSILERAAAVAAEKLSGVERELEGQKHLSKIAESNLARKSDELSRAREIVSGQAATIDALKMDVQSIKQEVHDLKAAHENALAELLSQHDAEIAQARTAIDQAKSDGLAITGKAEALSHQIAGLKVEIAAAAERNVVLESQMAVMRNIQSRDMADAQQVIEWIHAGAKDPDKQFNSGPERRIALAVAQLIQK